MLRTINTQVQEQLEELDSKEEEIENLKKSLASVQREKMQLRRRLEMEWQSLFQT